jgi:large subunit ribosomal protein L6
MIALSRVAKQPVVIPKGVELNEASGVLTFKGPKVQLTLDLNSDIGVGVENGQLSITAKADSRFAYSMAGTTRALISNMVTGVSEGFERKLELVGVGYRAKAQGNSLNLTLGFSHPVDYAVPAGIEIETPTQTEIVIRGVDKQKVGQVAAEIRRFRPPEPYKGKGVRYAGEHVLIKEAKKK